MGGNWFEWVVLFLFFFWLLLELAPSVDRGSCCLFAKDVDERENGRRLGQTELGLPFRYYQESSARGSGHFYEMLTDDLPGTLPYSAIVTRMIPHDFSSRAMQDVADVVIN